MFIVGKIVSFLLLPPGSVFSLLLLAGLLALFKKSERALRFSRIIGGLAICVLCLSSLDPLADLLLYPLENRYQALLPLQGLEKKDFEGVSAVVILGAGSMAQSPEEGGGSSLSLHAARRFLYALRIAQRLNLPLLYTGGRVFETAQEESEAEAAGRYLADCAIDAGRYTIEAESKSTWENAKYTAALLRKEGSSDPKVILVTSAFHMPRAMASFRKHGLDAVPAPSDYLAKRGRRSWADWMPGAEAMIKIHIASHEYLGGIWYFFKPKAKP